MDNVIMLPTSECMEVDKVLYTSTGLPFARVTFIDDVEGDVVNLEVVTGMSLRASLKYRPVECGVNQKDFIIKHLIHALQDITQVLTKNPSMVAVGEAVTISNQALKNCEVYLP